MFTCSTNVVVTVSFSTCFTSKELPFSTLKHDNEKMPRNPANELSLHFYGPLNNLMYRFFWQSMLQHAVQQACEIGVKTFVA